MNWRLEASPAGEVLAKAVVTNHHFPQTHHEVVPRVKAQFFSSGKVNGIQQRPQGHIPVLRGSACD